MIILGILSVFLMDIGLMKVVLRKRKKYKTKKEFAEKANGAKHVATQNGWINDYTWFEKPFRWTRELCEEEARKYNTKQEFIIQNRSAYYAAVKHGWLDYFTWLKNVKHPNGYWTKERCENESRKYQSKKEFLCGCPAAHAAAVRMGWIDDYVWLVDKRIDITKDKIDSVYVYIFEWCLRFHALKVLLIMIMLRVMQKIIMFQFLQ